MRFAVVALLVLAAAPLFAIDDGDCRTYAQLGALYEIRSRILSSNLTYTVDEEINRRIDDLRGPTGDGGYRWVEWVRPEGDGPVEKHVKTVRAVQGVETDSFDARSRRAFGVRIVVPRKRSLLNANNAVYVGTVAITYYSEGRERSKKTEINAWMNPDTSRTIDLGAIADHVEVSLTAATKKPQETVVEVHFRQALATDVPDNPAYDAIRSLVRVRDAIDERYELDQEIARVERATFPGAEPVPLITLISELKRADELLRSNKPEQQEKGAKLFRETMRRLR